MNIYSIYSLDSGVFTGKRLMCAETDLSANVPEGCSCIVGEYDALSQKVSLVAGEVIDYIPPQPSANHQWDVNIRRWLYVKTTEDVAAEVRLKGPLYWQLRIG